MTQLLNSINLSNTLWFKNLRKTIKYSLKREGAFNRLREHTASGNSTLCTGDSTLCSNCWAVRGTLLQSILDNWAVFQELCHGILEGKVDSEVRGQMQSFNFFFGI